MKFEIIVKIYWTVLIVFRISYEVFDNFYDIFDFDKIFINPNEILDESDEILEIVNVILSTLMTFCKLQYLYRREM